MQPAGGQVFTGRPESRSDDGQTIRPVRNMKVRLENATWLDLILEEWRMPKRNAKSDHMQRKSPTCHAVAEASHTIETRVGTPCGVPSCRSEIGADIVWLGGVSNVGIRGIRGTMTNIRLCVLIMGI